MLAALPGCLLSCGSAAIAQSSVPQFDHVIVVIETAKGSDKGVLEPLQLYFDAGAARSQQQTALLQALRMPELYSGLTLALACPQSVRYQRCRGMSVLRDVQVQRAINQMPNASILLVKPAAGIFADEPDYRATMQVVQLSPGGKTARVLKRFTVAYRDFACTGDCLKSAHDSAAQELAQMTHYMLNISFGPARDRNPPSWNALPAGRAVSRWTNGCVKSTGNIVAADTPRAWVTSSADIPLLTSYAWSGCS